MTTPQVLRGPVASARAPWLDSLAQSQPALADWAGALRASIAADTAVGDDLDRIAGKGLLIETNEQPEVEYALETIAEELGIALVHADATNIDELLQSERVESPTLVQVAFGPWISAEDNDATSLEARRRLMAIMADPRDRRVFVVCAPAYLDLAATLRRAGRFDAYLGWEAPTPEHCVQDFFEACAGVRVASEVTRDLDRLGRFLCVRFPGRRRIGLLGIAMRRLSHRTGRAIGMHDLMAFAADGTQMRSRARPMRDERQVAIHEAGHALAYLVANDWARFPDFVSIVPGRDYLGVMIESFCQTHRTEQQITVREMGVRLKTLLGGRAAEQCVFGDEEVSAFGAVDDLAEVRAIAQRLVAEAGIVVEAGSIRVRPWAMRADAGDTEAAAIASATLALVEHCWNEVVAMIREHRALLLRIADALIARRCLIDSDMRALIEADAKRFEWAA